MTVSDAVVAQFERLVLHTVYPICKKYRLNGEDCTDMVSVGMMTLVETLGEEEVDLEAEPEGSAARSGFVNRLCSNVRNAVTEAVFKISTIPVPRHAYRRHGTKVAAYSIDEKMWIQDSAYLEESGVDSNGTQDTYNQTLSADAQLVDDLFLKDCINQISTCDRDKQVLAYRLEGMTYSEIADLLGYSEMTIGRTCEGMQTRCQGVLDAVHGHGWCSRKLRRGSAQRKPAAKGYLARLARRGIPTDSSLSPA